MAKIDKAASNFVKVRGDALRAMLPANILAMPNGPLDEVPEELKGYTFMFQKAPLNTGATRVLIEGWREILWGISTFRVFDSFDLNPDGTIAEIRKSDEDHCGRA